jgi:hypothetical protein
MAAKRPAEAATVMSLRPISLPQALEPYTGAVFPATRRSVAPHCSPDGSRIAFASTSRAGEQFWIGEPERGDPVMESRLDPGTSIATLDWFDVERLLVSVLDARGARRGPVRRRHIVAHHPGAC